MSENNEIKRGFDRKMTLAEKIKCSLSCVAVLLFALWMWSILVLLVLPFIIDLYWTKYIPWSWWRNIENAILREIMSWVDAIAFAVVFMWVLTNFFFQNFQIPTTSLEKTMMAGDYLCVSKYEYGPRVPMTPLSLPIFQHTIDLFGVQLGKSYFDKPQVAYRRMKGLRDIQRGDIVVFNYPKGDSIMSNAPEGDYYDYRAYLEASGMSSRQIDRTIGPVFCRPVDRRENYVKRCIGLPGDTLQIIDRQVYIDGTALENPAEMQSHYLVYTNGPAIPTAYWKKLGVYTVGGNHVMRDVEEWPAESLSSWAPVLGIEPDSMSGQYNHLYRVNLTVEKAKQVAERKDVAWIRLEPLEMEGCAGIFPGHPAYRWKANSFGPLWIPKAGASIDLNEENVILYGRCIRTYEGNTLSKNADGVWLINGKETTSYTFKMDYYWMMGDNRDNSADSRFWGFVPEDHIVGTPLFIWISIDQETGAYRWDRLLKGVKGI